MSPILKNITIAAMMIAASSVAIFMRPTHRIADEGPAVNLASVIPKQFGDWHETENQSGQIINPQVKEKLDRIYTQTLSRNYMNAEGEVIMLSIAYGMDQSDAKQMHYPEGCYPAQGFEIKNTHLGVLKTDFGDIPVRRIFTVLGNRSEPLTYWTTVGNKVVPNGTQAKLEQLRYGFRGEIPDGLLFRVSSITDNAEGGYQLQVNFVRELVAVLSDGDRSKLAGLKR
jgi:EpsI family protein